MKRRDVSRNGLPIQIQDAKGNTIQDVVRRSHTHIRRNKVEREESARETTQADRDTMGL